MKRPAGPANVNGGWVGDGFERRGATSVVSMVQEPVGTTLVVPTRTNVVSTPPWVVETTFVALGRDECHLDPA